MPLYLRENPFLFGYCLRPLLATNVYNRLAYSITPLEGSVSNIIEIFSTFFSKVDKVHVFIELNAKHLFGR